jgi:hypothetical protein
MGRSAAEAAPAKPKRATLARRIFFMVSLS